MIFFWMGKMGDIVGIICEYNPFHRGHKYQIDKIKEKMPDATIIGIMSGNVVQRGEFAIIGKYKRAFFASKSGLDGVFEIPYPYCGSTAEIFANAGVEIAHQLGCNYICFGTEHSQLSELEKIAEIIDSGDFEAEIRRHIGDNISYLNAKQIALEKYGYSIPKYSNDILALEYIRAIRNKKINLEYFSIERIGAKYNDLMENEIMSASAIRNFFNDHNTFRSVPKSLENDYIDLINNGSYLSIDKVNDFLYHYAVLAPREAFDNAFDSCLEIGAIIKSSARESKNSIRFFEELSSRAYTSSRIKRVILYALFGIDEVDKKPDFSILLYANDKCKQMLKSIRKSKDFSVLTKTADAKALSEKSKKQFEALLKLDELYLSFLKEPSPPKSAYEFKPIIK